MIRAVEPADSAEWLRLRLALGPDADVGKETAEEGYFYQIGVLPIRVDILMGITGVGFEDAWSRRREVDFDGLSVPFISKEDLIATKFASGRPQDLIDASVLSQTAL